MLRRSLAVPLSLCLLTGGSVSGCSAPTWEVRGGARRPPRRSPPATGRAAAPPRAEPGLLSWSPLLCGTHTGKGSGGGAVRRRRERKREVGGGGSRGRELGTVGLSGLQSQCAHASGETSRLPLLGGQKGSPPSVGAHGCAEAPAVEAWRAQPNSAGG